MNFCYVENRPMESISGQGRPVHIIPCIPLTPVFKLILVASIVLQSTKPQAVKLLCVLVKLGILILQPSHAR